MILEESGKLTVALKNCKSKKQLRSVLMDIAVRTGVEIDPRRESPDGIAAKIGIGSYPDSRKVLREMIYRFY